MQPLYRVAWRGRSGVSLVIAVSKADLYWRELDSARDWYLPQSGSPSAFSDRLEELVRKVGEAQHLGDHRPSELRPDSLHAWKPRCDTAA